MTSEKKEKEVASFGKVEFDPFRFVLYLAVTLAVDGIISAVVSFYNLVIALVMLILIFVLALIALIIYYRYHIKPPPEKESVEDFVKKHTGETLYFQLPNKIINGEIVQIIPSEVIIKTAQGKEERIRTTSIRHISSDFRHLKRKP